MEGIRELRGDRGGSVSRGRGDGGDL